MTRPRDSVDPVAALVEQQGFLVLDGGLATALEARGCDLDDPLWSAKVLVEEPDLVREVHRAFLDAGADCIATVTYQATFEGFRARGIGDADAERLFVRAVDLALAARADFWSRPENRMGRLPPLVAASVGPYGAYLADGSEYTGDYDLDVEGLHDFHRRRWRVLAESEADLLACETIPSGPEVKALLGLIEETPRCRAWISLSCADAERLRDGSSIAAAATACDQVERVAAVGVNCVAPSLVPELVAALAAHTTKPILAYPNSGEGWDAEGKRWRGRAEEADWTVASRAWARAGARGIGGCCRVSPEEIGRMRAALLG